MLFTTVSLSVMAVTATFIFLSSMCGDREARPQILTYSISSFLTPDIPLSSKCSLKVMTLNIAHGRCDGPNQVLQNDKNLKINLLFHHSPIKYPFI